MLGSYNIYDECYTIIKDFGDTLEVTYLSKHRKPGFELDKPLRDRKYIPQNTVNDEKLDCNIARARSKVKDLGRANDWQYFVTLTLDSEKMDRFNLDDFHCSLSKFIHNCNRRRPADGKIKYLLIPELHKDGAWHMHGLMMGFCDDDLTVNEHGYLDWPAYRQRFGFISLGGLRNRHKAVHYILKYIGKGFSERTRDLGAHLYYHSRGLQEGDIVYKGNEVDLLCPWDYEHPDGYCKKKTFDLLIDDYTKYLKFRE